MAGTENGNAVFWKNGRALPSQMAPMQQVLQYPNPTFLFAVSQMPAQLIGKTDNSIY